MRYLPLLLILLSITAFAQDSRWIDIEWEEVQGAARYEVELFEEAGGTLVSRGKHKVETPGWSNAVPPGKYSLRIRSLDKRGVPGEWSDYIPVKVRMHNPKLFRPLPGSKVDTPQVEFEWSEVEGAAAYQLILKDSGGRIIHNGNVADIRTSLYLEDLGEYTWTAIALEEGEEGRETEEIPAGNFKPFSRVGGELEIPEVRVSLDGKVIIEWEKVRYARAYEIDFIPPAGKDKNRRFKIAGTRFAFPMKRLKDGVSVITVKATAPGYPDSQKSVIQLAKSGENVEVQDIIQPKKEDKSRITASELQWKNQIFVAVDLGKFSYSSTEMSNDTELDQNKLTGLGLSIDWRWKPKLNSLQRRAELTYLQLSSGRESGTKIQGALSLNNEKRLGRGRITFGGGVTLLRLPAYLGNRFEDDFFVEHSDTAGPHAGVSYYLPFSSYWGAEVGARYSHQILHLSSERRGGDNFGWMAANTKLMYFMTRKEAIYLGLDYQRWKQEWADANSDLSGYTLSIGLKAGF